MYTQHTNTHNIQQPKYAAAALPSSSSVEPPAALALILPHAPWVGQLRHQLITHGVAAPDGPMTMKGAHHWG